MDRYKILIVVTIVSLIFDNIPKILQLNTISSGFANKLTWYPLSLLVLFKLVEIYKNKLNFKVQDKYQLRLLGILLGVLLISNIQGLLIYPYYSELLNGPLSQIEKLPRVLLFFSTAQYCCISSKFLNELDWNKGNKKNSFLCNLYFWFFLFIV